ncbi:MAG: S9 family peptidase [Gemmatimonadetes bacterium]|nr:S9 family peptidase [Gemmatimonadota bacterium]
MSRPGSAIARGFARIPSVLAVLLGAVAPAAVAQEPYRLPPKEIVDILDAPTLPTGRLSPDRTRLLLVEQPSMASIADLSQPLYRLAGERINPRTNGPFRPNFHVSGLTLKTVADGAERRVSVPAGSVLGFPQWSPDGRRVSFVRVRDDGIELWVADAATGEAKRVTDARLNAVQGDPCEWMPDAAHLLCQLVPEGRGPEPKPPAVPVGPVVQQSSGKAAPERTHEDMLTSPYDEALYDYYFTAQLGLVDVASGQVTKVGAPAIFEIADPSPDGKFILIRRTVRPYSYHLGQDDFAKETEVWSIAGEKVRAIASQPAAEGTPLRGVRTGPRSIGWVPTEPATLYWAEALDGGDPRRPAEYRDHVLVLAAPFAGEPRELIRLKDRFQSAGFASGALALVTEFNREKRWTRTWIAQLDQPAAAARKLWDRSAEDRYGDPGDPIHLDGAAQGRFGRAPSTPLVRKGDWIYLAGAGASPEGERPFLDRLNLRTLRTERLWRGDADHYEAVVALLDDDGRRFLTRRESATEPPNYFVRQGRGAPRALTAFADPAPAFTKGVQKRLVVYKRDDGVTLSGTLYLPPNYKEGTRLPAVIWAYPREYASAAAASQVAATTNRFTMVRRTPYLLFTLEGYAVFDGPSMPILGGDTANNHYVEQLVASAKAAVDELDRLGVVDRDRVGVAGHSYGAFMTANLLAHSDLFRAGAAESGAYNRTLTPFGFQNEQRTYWEVPDLYNRMSPFQNASKINEPLLLIHGMADDNDGTWPINSERLYAALKGLGGTVRFVYLPHEAHGYAARESILDVLAEELAWFDKYVKNAPPRHATSQ